MISSQVQKGTQLTIASVTHHFFLPCVQDRSTTTAHILDVLGSNRSGPSRQIKLQASTACWMPRVVSFSTMGSIALPFEIPASSAPPVGLVRFQLCFFTPVRVGLVTSIL